MASGSRGGRRPGAGRPHAYTEPLVRKSVTLPESYISHLLVEGQGNLSEGIRWVLEQACTPAGKPWFDLGKPGAPSPAPPPAAGPVRQGRTKQGGSHGRPRPP